jgi:hypothetical protein
MFGPVASRPTCGLIARNPRQWAWTSQALGFEVTWVWSPDTATLPDWLCPAFPRAYFTTVVSTLRKVDLILCNSKPPTWLGSWELLPLIVATASTRALQSTLDRRVQIRHSAMGGLAERKVTLRLYSRLDLTWNKPRVPSVLPSCVYSVASDTVDLGVMVPRPHTHMLPRPYVQAVGSGCYHGGGLYPLNTKGRPKFVLPSVLHRPTGWCRRALTSVEDWMVLDVPWSITQVGALLEPSARDALWKRLFPGRCLEYGLRHLLSGFGTMDGGGILCLPRDNKRKFEGGESGEQGDSDVSEKEEESETSEEEEIDERKTTQATMGTRDTGVGEGAFSNDKTYPSWNQV